MAKKEDLRVQKTKRSLYGAFIGLLGEKSFDDITVDELCNRANVRRATFYKHYNDKYTFLSAFVKSLREYFDHIVWRDMNNNSTAEYYVTYAKMIVNFVSRHEREIDNILYSSHFNTVLSLIIEQNYEDTKARLIESEKAGIRLSAPADTVASMCAGGVAVTIYNWLIEGKKNDADSLAEEIGAMVKRMI